MFLPGSGESGFDLLCLLMIILKAGEAGMSPVRTASNVRSLCLLLIVAFNKHL